MIGLAALTSAWAADIWWVADPQTAAELEAALAATWPEREVEVVVGPHPESAAGLTWDRRLLVSYGEDGVRHAEVEDATVAALLARSWALPAAPTGPERYLPEAPIAAPAEIPPPPEEDRPRRFRLSTGIGARGAFDPHRPAEGLRLVNELQRGPVLFQGELFLGLDLQHPIDLGRVDPEEGVALVLPMDRATVGLGAGLETGGALGLRVLLGPELRFVEHWLFYRGRARESAPALAGGGRLGAGLDLELGRLHLSPAAWVRASAPEPELSVGATLDLRFRWRR